VHMKNRVFGNFLVSMPFLNYGGLLCDDESTERLLLDEVRQLRGELGASHVELRHLRKCGQGLKTKEHKVSMVLDLEKDEKEQWTVFKAKVRNHIRKSQKSGLTARIGGMELLDGFYRVFCRNMRDLGTPVYSREFFRQVLTAFPERSWIISVFFQGTEVASGIAMAYRQTLEVPWASSNRDYLFCCPNNLMYWEAIRLAFQKRLTRFDFGRSSPGDGPYRFKEQWGARPVPLYWQYVLPEGQQIPDLNPGNPKYRMAIRMWQKLPVWMTRILGPSIVRSIP
jgi:serine/alanine adding enzyme